MLSMLCTLASCFLHQTGKFLILWCIPFLDLTTIKLLPTALMCNVKYIVVVPAAPRNLNYTDLTATGVILTWRRPDPPNGLIIQYNVSHITNM